MEIETTDPLDLIERDPIALAKGQRDRSIARELSRLPDEFRDNVLRQPLTELNRRVESAIKSFRNDLIDGALNDFAQTLRSAVSYEFANNPALRPWSASEAIKPWVNRLVELHFNGYEISLLTQMLQKVGGETIRDAALREITTDRRVIARADLRAFAQGPSTWDNQRDFERAFTSETILANAELAAAHEKREREHPVYRSGPPRLIGTPITQN